ncbi:glutathione peroxidase [Catenovulum sediminis]|uniref:glutathione peroxidase n=1 Tax=Catenovulum sediminis TaxID=1740262 RepID=UPI00117D0B31|nr:glutathione peroxidase [Catenovulum sediminis]
MSDIYQFSVKNAQGELVSLAQYKGKWLLIVNTASKCGFTPQYEGLQNLYQAFSDKLTVLAFPCNQFGQQEPGDNEEIQDFCNLMFKVEFPVFAKVDVNGENADPLFQFLKHQQKGVLGSESIKWNFTKFLISPKGDVVKRYASTTKPEKIGQDLKEYIK